MTTIIPPPAFEEHLTHAEDSLPGYTGRVAPSHAPHHVEEKEFEYKIEKKKGETLASLKVLAPAAYSKNVPTFCGAGHVKGSVNLYLDEPDTITSVVVSVRGRFLPGHTDRLEHFTLFDMSDTVWSKDADEIATNPLLSNKKLSGTHSWPFTFHIPEKVQFPASGSTNGPPETMQYYLPQSFNERTMVAGVRYEIVMYVGRGRFKSDYDISCTFGYFPITRPPPFPALKSIAYQERTPLLDPTIDVEGWIPSEKVKITGTLFNSQPVTVDCQLFISAPVAYTRGSVIPLYVCMKSNSQHAVDLLATHKVLQARLERKVRYSLPMKSIKSTEDHHSGKDQRGLAQAIWWPATPQEQDALTPGATDTVSHTVYLSGEIHLRGDLAPSTTFPPFNIEYYVCLNASGDSEFKIVDAGKDLLVHPVDIVTSYAPGPRPIRYAPPGYEEDKPLVMEFGLALSQGNAFM